MPTVVGIIVTTLLRQMLKNLSAFPLRDDKGLCQACKEEHPMKLHLQDEILIQMKINQ